MAASRDLANFGDTLTGVSNVNIDSDTLFVDATNNRVGIGTSFPNQKLQVDGGLRIGASATLTSSTAPGLLSYEYPDFRVYVGDGSGYSVRFSKRASNTTTDYVTINDQGSVGIGTTSPSKKLAVSDNNGLGIELSPNDAAQSYNRIINYNRTTSQYVPVRYEGSTHGWYANTNGAVNAMNINTAGIVTKPGHPAFQAYGAGFGSQYFNNRYIGNYATYNNGSYFSAMAGGGTGRFTAPVAGFYYFYAGVLWYGSTQTTTRQIYILKNGSNFNNNYEDSAGPNHCMVISCILNLSASDYVEAYCQSPGAYFYDNAATAGTYGASTYNWFGGYLLG